MNAWEQREDESSKAYAAFVSYLELGTDRSIDKAAARRLLKRETGGRVKTGLVQDAERRRQPGGQSSSSQSGASSSGRALAGCAACVSCQERQSSTAAERSSTVSRQLERDMPRGCGRFKPLARAKRSGRRFVPPSPS